GTSTAALSTMSLHDALPISEDEAQRLDEVTGAQNRNRTVADQEVRSHRRLSIDISRHGEHLSTLFGGETCGYQRSALLGRLHHQDRKSTRLNSSHVKISYAV